MQAGFYRVHLVAPDAPDNWILLYVPIDERGYCDTAAGPALLKSEWSGNWYLGEFVTVPDAEWNRIKWNASVADSITDLLRAPLGQGALVRVHMGDDIDTQYYDFEVRELAKLR